MNLARIVSDEIFHPLGDFVVAGIDLSSFPNVSMEVVGDGNKVFYLASISKMITSLGILVAYEEGLFDLDTQLSPMDTPLIACDLLSHSSGLPFDVDGYVSKSHLRGLRRGDLLFDRSLVSAPRTKRIYSNLGFELMCTLIEDESDMPLIQYLREAIFIPLGASGVSLSEARFEGSGPTGGAARLRGSVDDLVKLVVELFHPSLIQEETLKVARTPLYPELQGLLPGFGRFERNTFGLGFEVHGTKSPHWMSDATSWETFGHFGASGVFAWLDPISARGLIFLGERDFSADHRRLWPILSERFALA